MTTSLTYRINPVFEKFTADFERIPSRDYSPTHIFCRKRNIVERTDIAGIDMVVKKFKRPNLINRIIYGNFRPSKADRSFDNALKFEAECFLSPQPIAVISRKCGPLFLDSWYVCRHIDATPIADFISEDDRPTMRRFFDSDPRMKAFLKFATRLFAAGIYQIDFNRGNFLVVDLPDGGFDFALVDINRIIRRKVTPAMIAMAFKKFGADRCPGLVDDITRSMARKLGFPDDIIDAQLKKHAARSRRADFTRKWRKRLKRAVLGHS